MINNKEVVKRIDRIFERMRFTQFYSLSYVCPVDSLVRIYEGEEVYNCGGCILTDTISRYVGCPLIIKENLKGVK